MTTSISKSRKGFIGDTLTLIVFFFIIAVTILAVYLIVGNVKTSFDNTSGISTTTKTIMTDYKNNYVGLWDGIFGFLLVMLSLAAVASAFFIDTHPVLLPFVVIVLAIYVFISAAVANAYYAVEASGSFISVAEEFTIMHFVMSHLAYYAAIIGISIMIALFAKARQ